MKLVDFSYDLLCNGFKKVVESSGTLVTAGFYNPSTDEFMQTVVRDYDYADCSRDKDDLYDMEIDKETERIYRHAKGEILENDLVMVLKGRKVPVGTVGTVKKIYPYKDKYGRIVAYYAYMDNGYKTNVDNLGLVVNS